MKPAGKQTPSGGINLQDILFVLFKHKWKIVLFSLLGIGAAAALYLTSKPLYESRSKLLVRYVIQRNEVDNFEQQAYPGGRSGQHVIVTEEEIITSRDLATAVAEAVGVERLLPDADGAVTAADAAGIVLGGLTVEVASGSQVIHVNYSHPDPKVAVDVLKELIQRYFVRHLEIHRSTGAFDYVAKQAESARSRLRQVEEEINTLKLESGILSLPDTVAALEIRRTEVKNALSTAEAELSGQRAKVEAIEAALGLARKVTPNKKLGPDVPPVPDSDERDPAATAAAGAELKASSVALSDYQALVRELEVLREQRTSLLSKYTATSRSVISIERRIKEVKAKGLELIEQHPELVARAAATAGEVTLPDTVSNIDTERALLAGSAAAVETLRQQVGDVEKEVERVSAIEVQLHALERRKLIEEEKYTYLASSLEKARVDETLDPTKIQNISMVQEPSVPVRVFGELTKKLMLGLAGGGVALGIGLAFLLEIVIDRRIKRPLEISNRMQLPLMLSIPYYRLKERGGALLTYDEGSATTSGGEDLILPPVREGGRGVASSGKSDHFILPFSKAIRDRIVFNFEVNDVRHKPKLVALTGLSNDAGTSTIAAGVARAFAESEGLKVLFVDLSMGTSSANSLLGGRAAQSLDGVLRLTQGDRLRSGSQNLFVASGTTYSNGSGPTPLAPMQLYGLIPKLQASDFDYIIFDMPPLDQTSPTLAMAGFMDKVLLILDADCTSREDLQWGYSELARGSADVSCIYNKARSHAPRWVEGVS